MGPSGAGKTSLLEALAGHGSSGLDASGEVTVDGVAVGALPRGSVAVVPQESVLPEELTPREAMRFAAALRLRRVADADRATLVDLLLAQLSLGAVADARIGGRLAGGGGLSGGERRRASVGVALVGCPRAVLLDEGLSGLDGHSALLVASLLCALGAKADRLVALSVHQPSSHIFQLFDSLVLLGGGRLLYRGPPLAAAAALERRGAPAVPPGVAPADHLLHVLATTPLDAFFADGEDDTDGGGGDDMFNSFNSTRGAPSPRRPAAAAACGWEGPTLAWLTQCRLLGWRCVAQLAREPSLLLTQLLVHVGMGFVMGAVFYQVSSDLAGLQNKGGAFQFLLTLFAIGGLSTAGTVTREWPLLWLEHRGGAYAALPYVVSRLLLELLLLRALPAVAFGGVFYAFAGLRAEGPALATFLGAAALASCDAALLCSAVAACAPRQPGASALVSSVLLLVCLLFSGFQLNLPALPPAAAVVADVSFARHAFEIMLTTELDGQLVTVAVPGAPPVQLKASVIFDVLGLDASRTAQDFGVLLLIGLVLLLLTAAIVGCQLRRAPLLRRCGGGGGGKGGGGSQRVLPSPGGSERDNAKEAPPAATCRRGPRKRRRRPLSRVAACQLILRSACSRAAFGRRASRELRVGARQREGGAAAAATLSPETAEAPSAPASLDELAGGASPAALVSSTRRTCSPAARRRRTVGGTCARVARTPARGRKRARRPSSIAAITRSWTPSAARGVSPLVRDSI